ncbi:MAG: helix-turn-helix transcriptional regulator [Bacteroidota bacterium]
MPEQLQEGQFYGNSNFKACFNGITITDTEYTYPYVDWHCHENPHFTFLLQGKLIEENKKEAYQLTRGDVVFHNWQDFHRNIKPPEFSRGAHVEIKQTWAKALDIDLNQIEGSIQIQNPRLKNLVFKVLLESRQADLHTHTSIELLLLEILTGIHQDQKRLADKRPSWLDKLEILIYENRDNLLRTRDICAELGIHPVHLSRTFHKHYGITFGQYGREIRLNKAVNSILARRHRLTDIAYLAQYYDQSHMNAAFRKHFKTTPKKVIKLIG